MYSNEASTSNLSSNSNATSTSNLTINSNVASTSDLSSNSNELSNNDINNIPPPNYSVDSDESDDADNENIHGFNFIYNYKGSIYLETEYVKQIILKCIRYTFICFLMLFIFNSMLVFIILIRLINFFYIKL